jgi:hypothetical protein
MRNLASLLLPFLMAGIMLVGTKWFRNSSGITPTSAVSTANSSSVRSLTAEAKTQTRSTSASADHLDVPLPKPDPVPDPISETPESDVHSIRHQAPMHPEMITPGNFEYLGAFLPPHLPDEESSFSHSSGVLAFHPDPTRPATETHLPGSLYLTGHMAGQQVAEISIPRPVLSKLKRADDLSRAELLQPLTDVTGGIMRRVSASLDGSPFRIGGLQVAEGRLHWTMHIYYNAAQYDPPTHGSSALDFSQLDARGPWCLGDPESTLPEWHADKHGGYLFQIPPEVSRKWMGGLNLLCGLWTSQGLQNSSHGPAMFAFRSSPDAIPETGLPAKPLVWYPNSQPLKDHHAADRWGGGAWLTLGTKQAVIVIGQKALGPVYYGLARAVDCDENKGWHGPPYETQVYLYSTASLIHAAHGAMEPGRIQPWMRWTDQSAGGGFGQYLFPRCYRDVGGVAWDSENSLLYVSQPNSGATSEQPFSAVPVIHVFRLTE